MTFESEFAAKATACDKAAMEVKLKSDVTLELGSDKPMCFTSAFNTYRGGSNTKLPGGAGEKFTNLAQCVYDLSRSSPDIKDICAKPDNTLGTETCTCDIGLVTSVIAALKRLEVTVSSNAFPLVGLNAPALLRAAHTNSRIAKGEVVMLSRRPDVGVADTKRDGGRSEHATLARAGRVMPCERADARERCRPRECIAADRL